VAQSSNPRTEIAVSRPGSTDLFRSTATIECLEVRAQLLKELRAFFDELGFTEVQTPVLSRHTVIDRHIDPIMVAMETSESNGTSDWYLQSSPEATMKRLLACGMKKIYQVGPVFRAGEIGRLHNPEFTLAEWYRVDDDLEAGLQLLDDLTRTLLETPSCVRIRFADAFQSAIDLDVMNASISDLAHRAIELNLVDAMHWSDDWDDWVNLLFSIVVQPTLGHATPTLVTHFPASQAALAKLAKEDNRLAERFELFYQGIELANGYHELLDPTVLRERNRKANFDRVRDGKNALPEESFLLDAMDSGLPASTGCALGFDRVVMLACRAKHIHDVIAFPSDRA